MKKLLSILFATIMVLNLCSCKQKEISELKTLNEIVEAKYEIKDYMGLDNVFGLHFLDKNKNEYLAIVKVPSELMNDYDEVSYKEEATVDDYLKVIGNLEVIDKVELSLYMPTQDALDSYKGMTIKEIEELGFYMTGYVGEKDDYSFDFEDERGCYCIKIKDKKLEGLDDFDSLYIAIQDIKIEDISYSGLMFNSYYEIMEQYLDEPERYIPVISGNVVSSINEVNEAIGTHLNNYPNATDEEFAINGDVGEYIFKVNDTYCAIRTTKNLVKQIIDLEEGKDNLQDPDGNYHTSYIQNDILYSVRFVQDGVKYSFIVFDSNIEWNEFETMVNVFKDCIK